MAPGRKRASPALAREGGRFIVGSAEEGETACPHEPQKRLPAGSGVAQLEHVAAAIPRRLTRGAQRVSLDITQSSTGSRPATKSSQVGTIVLSGATIGGASSGTNL